MTRQINKVIKGGTEYQFTDKVAQDSIALIVDELNKLEIPDSTSDLINDSGFITINDVNYKIVNILEDVTSPTEGILAYAISLKKIYKYNGSVWEELSTGGGGSSSNIVNLTQAEYDALATKDPNTIYNITDATDMDVYTKEEVDNKIPDISTKQDTLVSGTNIKTINGESVLGSGNITIQGGGGTGDYLPISGGTLTGKIQIGNATPNNNIVNAILHIRSCASSITGKKVNGACYSVNGDGTATLQHKTYNDDGSGAKNSAVLRMSNQGLQFAINTGSSSTPSEDMYKEIATQEYVDSKVFGKVSNLTQAEYDALATKDPNTIYNITDATDMDVYTKAEVDNKIGDIETLLHNI